MVWNVQPFMGTTYSIRLFVVVTAAGFGNLPGGTMSSSSTMSACWYWTPRVVRQLQQLRVRQAVQ